MHRTRTMYTLMHTFFSFFRLVVHKMSVIRDNNTTRLDD